jgi:hypothetical protein
VARGSKAEIHVFGPPRAAETVITAAVEAFPSLEIAGSISESSSLSFECSEGCADFQFRDSRGDRWRGAAGRYQPVPAAYADDQANMFLVEMPVTFETGHTMPIRLNGNLQQLHWRDAKTLVVGNLGIRKILDTRITPDPCCGALRRFVCSGRDGLRRPIAAPLSNEIACRRRTST